MDPIVERILLKTKEKNLNQKSLSKLIGVRQQSITDWKKGVTTSYTKCLPELAKVLGVSVDYLLYGEKEMPTVEDDGLTPQERDLIQRFRKLDQAGQMYVLGVTQAAADIQRGSDK